MKIKHLSVIKTPYVNAFGIQILPVCLSVDMPASDTEDRDHTIRVTSEEEIKQLWFLCDKSLKLTHMRLFFKT